ncbi:uncharacterized protein LOC118765167 [Octopus sinensis]|uniref:Uncharacterized protein LOC118765167 n=1 Tax=Octopus sinensis TaxID=2607531 RepID=A0A7E6F5V3_9MOLL|nr:uncharacterized protein LOC118765167 [Octopus sinensis]XP_036362691.1 uncharacterized protein LOC118765167 [Octopus sinensis]XP_036362692.1 uncharacterized protein LOC118765167 [Octopus sinensis]XP_036362693.1 uncharacterized protein LOC118765167 [Octopus sinensis]
METHKTASFRRSKPTLCNSKKDTSINSSSFINKTDKTIPSSFATSIYPGVYTQLDAKIAEKTRISNAGLAGQMQIQNRMLEKSKQHTLKQHEEEVLKLQNDLEKLHMFSPNLESKICSTSSHYSNSQITAYVHHTCRLAGSHSLCHRCYKHHTPYKNIYYQNWWLKKPIYFK